jgi:hypothetical protein
MTDINIFAFILGLLAQAPALNAIDRQLFHSIMVFLALARGKNLQIMHIETLHTDVRSIFSFCIANNDYPATNKDTFIFLI